MQKSTHVLRSTESMQQPALLSCLCRCPSMRGGILGRAGRARTCSADPEIMSIGHVLTCAWLSPAMPCTAPGPDTVSSTPGTPVKNPAAAAA